MERWRGRTALVTGASYGLGFAITEELLRQGMNVVACARTTTSLTDLSGELPTGHGKLYPMQCDLTIEENILKLFGWIKEKFGHVDVLINNAGVVTYCPISEGPTENLMAMMNLNVLAVAFCTREAFKLMQDNGIDDGHIINMNSTSGHDMELTDSEHGYSLSKHTVTSMTRALDMEMRSKKNRIRITVTYAIGEIT